MTTAANVCRLARELGDRLARELGDRRELLVARV